MNSYNKLSQFIFNFCFNTSLNYAYHHFVSLVFQTKISYHLALWLLLGFRFLISYVVFNFDVNKMHFLRSPMGKKRHRKRTKNCRGSKSRWMLKWLVKECWRQSVWEFGQPYCNRITYLFIYKVHLLKNISPYD